MRIVHVEDYFDPTAGYQINELLFANKQFLDDIFLITSNDMTPFHKKVCIRDDYAFEENYQVKIIRLNVFLKIGFRLILKNLNTTIDSLNPDILYMHSIADFKDLILWKKKKEYKIVRDCHMSWVASTHRSRKLFYFLYKLFFANIINNSSKYYVIYALGVEEGQYLRALGISEKKIQYLPHGYNKKIMYFDKSERQKTRSNYNFHEQDVVISYIGKFDFIKQPDIIFDIINKLNQNYINANKLNLLFIGSKENSYMIKFNSKMDIMKNKIRIVIDDPKPYLELRKYYSASDVCIFPKQTTLSSIHAQVCGCPVIMEIYDSNKERVINKDNLYKIDDILEAADILKRIIDNKEYKKNNINIDKLENREYSNQVNQIRSL